MIQPIGNICIMLIMNTALAAAVGVVELTAAANRVNLVEAQPIADLHRRGPGLHAAVVVAGRSPARSNEGWRSSDEQDAQLLFDEPGPHARRRIRIATVLGACSLAGAVALAVRQFASQRRSSPPTAGGRTRPGRCGGTC